MKRSILIMVFLFSIIFNFVFVYHLVTVHRSNSRVLDDISLSAEQQQVIKKKAGAILENNTKLNLELKKCRKDLYKYLDDDKPDRIMIKKCIDMINDIQKKMQFNTVEHLLVYKNHLSKPQRDCLMRNVGNKMGIQHKCKVDCKCR